MAGIVLGASPGYFRPGLEREPGAFDPEKTRAWAMAAEAWAEGTFGDRLVSSVLHADEVTPHIHLLVLPLDADGKLRMRSILPFRNSLRDLHTGYAKALGLLGIRRPEPGGPGIGFVKELDWYPYARMASEAGKAMAAAGPTEPLKAACGLAAAGGAGGLSPAPGEGLPEAASGRPALFPAAGACSGKSGGQVRRPRPEGLLARAAGRLFRPRPQAAADPAEGGDLSAAAGLLKQTLAELRGLELAAEEVRRAREKLAAETGRDRALARLVHAPWTERILAAPGGSRPSRAPQARKCGACGAAAPEPAEAAGHAGPGELPLPPPRAEARGARPAARAREGAAPGAEASAENLHAPDMKPAAAHKKPAAAAAKPEEASARPAAEAQGTGAAGGGKREGAGAGASEAAGEAEVREEGEEAGKLIGLKDGLEILLAGDRWSDPARGAWGTGPVSLRMYLDGTDQDGLNAAAASEEAAAELSGILGKARAAAALACRRAEAAAGDCARLLDSPGQGPPPSAGDWPAARKRLAEEAGIAEEFAERLRRQGRLYADRAGALVFASPQGEALACQIGQAFACKEAPEGERAPLRTSGPGLTRPAEAGAGLACFRAVGPAGARALVSLGARPGIFLLPGAGEGAVITRDPYLALAIKCSGAPEPVAVLPRGRAEESLDAWGQIPATGVSADRSLDSEDREAVRRRTGTAPADYAGGRAGCKGKAPGAVRGPLA
jgi:hypothetical protein